MKIKTLTRAVAPAGSSDATRQPRNLDPAAHPFERAREYTRAVNAVKLERMFAAPFIGDLGRGHVDGVYCMSQDPGSIERVASGSGDGVIKVWDLTSRDESWQTRAHQNIVKSLVWTPDRKIVSCATDKTVKVFDPYNSSPQNSPLATFTGTGAFTGLSHHATQSVVAAASSQISIYDLARPGSAPIQSLAWPTSTDTLTSVAFNPSPASSSVLASTALDRSVILYDLRTSTPLHKLILTLSSNKVAWNPQEPLNFAVASEDHNTYLFDMRSPTRALNVLKDHVAAVMDIAFSPTGTSLVSASYDRTVRLYDLNRGHSRDVYHTKRMQRVFSCSWTPDNNYILSGSDDGNIRVWRAVASSRSGVKSARQRQKLEYDAKLIQRYAHMPEIRRIKRHRHLPKVIKKAGEIKKVELGSIRRKEENVRKHSSKKDGLQARKGEREKMVLATER